ncbi:Msr family ABC-F type ribosomal protection protein [Alkalicoccobacillus porphyridii]|uniref:ABC-F type ribosomal protection protein n=1 Tax=Alkalicoccobacillus porphyridii TaxID=2597270 RepID=A0A553ZVQ1_9BACI|nr:ABC-F type ribosomal protection protein [Alkalicoccobacillus porphyridii]TSB45549.1 ABC-F type ribosomal protection protein [Alkalicoccobacillus porphyridii]
METLTIELTDIEVSFLDRTILKIPTLSVYQFDRIGIVGKNGQGKSTLLKVINGDIQPSKGQVKRFSEMGYFKQTTSPKPQSVDPTLLSKLHVSDNLERLSGGEQTRLKLAQLFSTYYEALLIDEPTSHLDTRGIDFLIEELRYYYGSLLLVSHDRYLLDQLVTKIWEISDGKITEYVGNYSDYDAQKKLEAKQHQEQYESYQNNKSRLQRAAEEKMKKAEKITQANQSMSKKEMNTPGNRMFMTKSKGTTQKSMQRAAKAIEKRVDQLEEVEAPEEKKVLRFHQSKALQMHNKFPIMANQLTLSIGDQLLLDRVSFQFPLGKTIAITGANGSGKSTLLRHIHEDREGITLSPKIAFGQYQQMAYQFVKAESVFNYVQSRTEENEGKIRAVLHAMNFEGNDLKKNIQDLSGGEAIRLTLCELFLGNYNVLILDEPTNFLDVDTMKALAIFIHAYQGTIILVSHDKRFVEEVADTVYEIKDLKLLQV